jgi:hypothetical protein
MSSINRGYRVVDLHEVEQPHEVWARVIAAAPQAWCWHTLLWREFVRSACTDAQALDLTFFVFEGGAPVALVPLVVSNVAEGEHTLRDASYNGGPLPWPAVVQHLQAAEIEGLAFQEAERRARDAGAERLRFASTSPFVSKTPDEWFEPIAMKLDYLDASYGSHLVTVDEHVFDRVRKKYRQNVRKHRDEFECRIVAGADVDEALERAYFELHVKDAGGQFRTRESYTRLADLARGGEAFFVTARDKASGAIAGVLLVSLVKGAAYDSSVAVDPDFQESFVSHVLKWRTLEHLRDLGVSHYELGMRNAAASVEYIPDAKTRGISFFKDGWSRGEVKHVYVAEKLLTQAGLAKHLRARHAKLEKLYGF